MFEESVTTSNCDASLHNGIWYKLSFRELQTGHWPVHVRIVCVSLHQLILGSMNKQSWNWISLVISQLRNFDILNNIERKQDFKLVAPSNLTPLLLFKPFAWEGSNDKVIYAGWIFQVCSTPVLFALCNGFATRYFHIFLMVKFLYLSQKMDQEPFDRWCSKF